MWYGYTHWVLGYIPWACPVWRWWVHTLVGIVVKTYLGYVVWVHTLGIRVCTLGMPSLEMTGLGAVLGSYLGRAQFGDDGFGYGIMVRTLGVPSLEMTGTICSAAYFASSRFIIILSSCSRSFLLSPSASNQKHNSQCSIHFQHKQDLWSAAPPLHFELSLYLVATFC